MAYLHFVFLLLCSFTILFNQFHAQLFTSPDSDRSLVLLHVAKDVAAHQYVTNIRYGTTLVPVNLVVDLGGPSTWLDFDFGHAVSCYNPIKMPSIQCSRATSHSIDPKNCISLFGAKRPCELLVENRVSKLSTRGKVVEDIMVVDSVEFLNRYQTRNFKFMFSLVPEFLLSGLASGAQGMLGLGRTTISLPSQVYAELGGPRMKFAMCLSSSSNGFISLGNYNMDSILSPKISRSMIYTPLVTSTNSQEYFINVRSIKVNNMKRLDITNDVAKISTIVPYTIMETKLYNNFVQAYLEVARSMNMTKVAPTPPFGHCFNATRKSMGPTIDFVLQSEMVKWRLHNSMVKISDGVLCLGFLDGGLLSESNNLIVIGGSQMEDNVLEFDLGTSMLGISTSLLTRQRSCSDFVLESKLYTKSL